MHSINIVNAKTVQSDCILSIPQWR